MFFFWKKIEVKEMAKKEKKLKKEKVKKERKPSYIHEVKEEMKKVTFPSAKEVTKYTIATICIVAFLVVFFLILTSILYWIKGAL